MRLFLLAVALFSSLTVCVGRDFPEHFTGTRHSKTLTSTRTETAMTGLEGQDESPPMSSVLSHARGRGEEEAKEVDEEILSDTFDEDQTPPETSFKGGSGFSSGGGYSSGGSSWGGSSSSSSYHAVLHANSFLLLMHVAIRSGGYSSDSYHFYSDRRGGGKPADLGTWFLALGIGFGAVLLGLLISWGLNVWINRQIASEGGYSEEVTAEQRADYRAFCRQSEPWVREASGWWTLTSQELSGPWKGNYREDGRSHDCFYNLELSPLPDSEGLHAITGRHGDSDGGGTLSGVANLRSGRMYWIEKYEGTILETAVRVTMDTAASAKFKAKAVNGLRIVGSIFSEGMAARGQAQQPTVNVVIQESIIQVQHQTFGDNSAQAPRPSLG
uniref:Uncharacterized protein n=1 Tax=Chromera velia CCMP2878 TaxID=1169474 RepID=A0A0G4HMI9_9ALVE|eukprot:Cvel_29284.t2-p1 / transcript=Cvel_29284.t2 / gene=Cvel_29284 / organism=Chromera_velia_CCMP2878 / gene_product=hypothetical protein / transcript_product=hypothetical protein / location=Cvel_scaffold3978:3554-6639(-) / protein_length=384 / sequence_SO=supercontig / SO=protein_coding / is_pseudo=false